MMTTTGTMQLTCEGTFLPVALSPSNSLSDGRTGFHSRRSTGKQHTSRGWQVRSMMTGFWPLGTTYIFDNAIVSTTVGRVLVSIHSPPHAGLLSTGSRTRRQASMADRYHQSDALSNASESSCPVSPMSITSLVPLVGCRIKPN